MGQKFAFLEILSMFLDETRRGDLEQAKGSYRKESEKSLGGILKKSIEKETESDF